MALHIAIIQSYPDRKVEERWQFVPQDLSSSFVHVLCPLTTISAQADDLNIRPLLEGYSWVGPRFPDILYHLEASSFTWPTVLADKFAI